jgi:hypothetical protein
MPGPEKDEAIFLLKIQTAAQEHTLLLRRLEFLLKVSLDVAIFLCGYPSKTASVCWCISVHSVHSLFTERILQCIRVPPVDDIVGVNSRKSGRCGAAVCTEQPTTSWRQC